MKLVSSEAMADKEPPGRIQQLPPVRLFDITILFDHMLNETT